MLAQRWLLAAAGSLLVLALASFALLWFFVLRDNAPPRVARGCAGIGRFDAGRLSDAGARC